MRNRLHPVGRREAIVTGCGVVATLLAACASTSEGRETAVNLKYTHDGRLTGAFAGRSVNVATKLPSGQGNAGGTIAEEPIAASWQIAYNGTGGQTVLPVTLYGSFAKQSLLLSATFRLMPNFLLESGTVTGTSNGRPVHADVTSASGESSSSVNVNGSFAGTAFSLYATLDLQGGGLVRGTVGGRPTHLTAKARSGAIHITGDYSGPSALFVLSAGSLIYFLGGIYA